MKRQTLYPILQAFFAALLFGASAPLAKLLLGEVEPIPLAGFLYLGSGFGAWLLLIVQRFSREGRSLEARLERDDIPWLTGTILAGGVAAPILLLWGLKQTPASTASLLLNFEAVATTLIAAMVFKEAVDRRILWAMGLITLASTLLSWTVGEWGLSLGTLGVLGACFLWGLDNNLTRHISAKNPLLIVGFKGLFAGTSSLALAALLGQAFPSWQVILLAMLLGSVSYGLSIYLFILAMRGMGAARTGTMFGIAPFVGVVLALLFLHETPTVLFWSALPLMLAGAWLMLSEDHTHHHIHTSPDHNHLHTHPDDHHSHICPPDMPRGNGAHAHWHCHENLAHAHSHTPDLHHRHGHGGEIVVET